MFLPKRIIEERLLRTLAEDSGQGDITTTLIVPEHEIGQATVIAKERGIAAGIEECKILLESLGLEVKQEINDGQKTERNQILIEISGDTRTILCSERTVLNIISRMSGIATKTGMLVEKLRKAKLNVRIACTRKTAPGLLYFDKRAVSIGGGDTHRLHLDDMILIKDNHIAVAGGIEQAIEKARKRASFSKKIEVEVTNVKDAVTAATMGVDLIMFDNFHPEQIEKTVQQIRKRGFGKIIFEASGGITSENILSYAMTGVDVVSLGEITAYFRGLDVSLEISPTETQHRKK